MEFVEASPEELNNFVVQNDGSFQQSWQWGELQEAMGRPVLRKFFVQNDEPLLAAAFVRHDLPLHKYYWLCTKGPVFVGNTPLTPALSRLGRGIKGEGDQPIFIRIEPEIFADHAPALKEAGWVRAPKDHSPKATLLLDLRQSEEELLRRMHPKTRYNIGIAQKKGIGIRNYESGIMEREVWGLFVETARRGGFQLHPKKYYAEMLKFPEIKLFGAVFEGELIAAAIISVFAGRGVYLHGASDYAHRSVMAPYLLHWEIMRWLKAQAVGVYDLGGVAPEGDADHPLARLNRFKSGFGGQYVEYVGSWDFVNNKLWYEVYRLARKIL